MTTPTTGGCCVGLGRRVAVAGCLIGVVLAGCGDDDGGAASSDTSDTIEPARWPAMSR